MALKNKDQFEEITEKIDEAIHGIHEEKTVMAKLSEARSVTRRQKRIDEHLSNIGTYNAQLKALIEETAKPVPRKKKVTPEELPGTPGTSDTPNEDGGKPEEQGVPENVPENAEETPTDETN